MSSKSERKQLLEIFDSIDFENIKKHPNILIAAAFWEPERYRAACTTYRFLRSADDLVDNYKIKHPAIEKQEQVVLVETLGNLTAQLSSKAGDATDRELVATWEKFLIPLWPVEAFTRSMVYDIHHQGFPSFSSFLEYAEGASVAPAGVFVHLCGLRKENGHYMPPLFDVRETARPCAIFSYLVHIIRDFQQDRLENLNYFPSDLLSLYGLSQEQLERMARGGPILPSFRNLVRHYMEVADTYRRETLQIINKVSPLLNTRYRLSLHIIFDLYLMVFRRIDPEKGIFTTDALNPSPDQIKAQVLNTILNYY
ncbi:MAG: squalene/phytoene synthase family protein [Bacteroidales bacterium]|jgi:phytoene/squalene synthetase|nr:squalene/phytoene synthase family protein [Bacteroidales bacterium]